jgi:riboflavin synthase
VVEKTGKKGEELRLSIKAPRLSKGLKSGDSLAVNGCCLTVVECKPPRLGFQVVGETLRRTTLGSLKPKAQVNLEPPLTLSEPLGGHLVQGHVDGRGEILELKRRGEGALLKVRIPSALAPYVIEKGSIALDGVSLTVAGIRGNEVEVALIPHTLRVTAFKGRKAGDFVNVEMDLVAKHLSKLSAPYFSKGKRKP